MDLPAIQEQKRVIILQFMMLYKVQRYSIKLPFPEIEFDS
jgi:hypothetical protein